MVQIPTTEREYQSVPKKLNELGALAGSLMPAAQNVQKLVRSQNMIKAETKITEARTQLDGMVQEWQMANQANPNNPEAVRKLEGDIKNTLNSYREQIDPTIRMDWDTSANKLIDGYKSANQVWGFKQRQTNAKEDAKTYMEQVAAYGYQHGENGNITVGLLEFEKSAAKMDEFLSGNMGEADKKRIMSVWRSDYVKSFMAGMADNKPDEALELLDDDLVIKSIGDAKTLRALKKSALAAKSNIEKAELDAFNMSVAQSKMEMTLNPTVKNFEVYKRFHPNMSEKEEERWTGMINALNSEATTQFTSLDEANIAIADLVSLANDSSNERVAYLNKASDLIQTLTYSNMKGNLSKKHFEELKETVIKSTQDNVFKKELENLPSIGVFKNIIKGAYLSPLWESNANSKIEGIAQNTMSDVFRYMNSGDYKSAHEAFVKGKEEAIKAKYWYLPEFQYYAQPLEPGKSVIYLDSTPYLFMGFGAEDVLVEKKK